MLLQLKVYWVGAMYSCGVLFMCLFPPRNFHLSGSKIRRTRSADNNLQYKQYLDYNTLKSTIKEFYKNDPDVVNVTLLKPLTAENRSVIAMELRSDKQSRKPGIFIIGGLDAMAWGAPNAVMELSHKLLYDASYQTPFFNDYDWYIIPMGNPDGIAFTQGMGWGHQIDSLNDTGTQNKIIEWHKNIDSREAGKSMCFGTNINRNFAYHWQDDVLKTPQRCSQYYPGEKPFSTAEAKAIRDYVDNLGNHISLAIHVHASFVPRKEYVLYPWRYSLRQPSNYRTLQEIGEYAARKSRLPDNRLYEVHQSSNDERVAGTLSDYITGVVGIDLVYILKPYHQLFPNYTDFNILSTYVKKSVTTILSVVRGWRSSTKQNTLHFFGKDIEF